MAAPTPNDALAYAKRFMGGMPVDDTAIQYRLLDDAHRKLWMAASWPWTIAALEVVTLVNDAQSVNLVTTPNNLQCLLHATLIKGTEMKGDLKISSLIPVNTTLSGPPTQVMYVPGSPGKLRFYPVPSGYITLPKIVSIYKKTAPIVDATSAAVSYLTTSGMFDEWFWVYQELVLLKAFQFTHDPRLGSITVAPTGVQHTGQYAVVEDGIRQMKMVEEKFFTTLGEPNA